VICCNQVRAHVLSGPKSQQLSTRPFSSLHFLIDKAGHNINQSITRQHQPPVPAACASPSHHHVADTMFTETPPSGRRVRGKPPAARQSMGPPQLQPTLPAQQPQQTTTARKVSGADHPATPLASVGPPNFSYGSSTHALPRQISLADTKMSIFAAMNKAAKDARERDIRAGKAVEPEPEGQSPLVRFYEEPLEQIPTGVVSPPKIRPLRDDPPRRSSPRRSTRTTRKSVERSQSVDSDLNRRTPTPSPSEGMRLG